MLLVDDDDVLPAVPDEGEAILLAQLEPDALLAIDAAIFDQTRQHWLKVARVVHGAIETGHFPIEDSVVDLHATSSYPTRARQSSGGPR